MPCWARLPASAQPTPEVGRVGNKRHPFTRLRPHRTQLAGWPLRLRQQGFQPPQRRVFGISTTGAALGAQQLRTIRLADQTAQPRLLTFRRRMTGDRHLAATIQVFVQRARPLPAPRCRSDAKGTPTGHGFRCRRCGLNPHSPRPPAGRLSSALIEARMRLSKPRRISPLRRG